MCSPNLESCPNELSKFGRTLDRQAKDPQWTHEFLKWSPKLLSPNMPLLFVYITILDCNSYYSLIPMSKIKSGCNFSYI